MSWKLPLGTAAVSAAALLAVLVHLERTAPLPEKPSILLRVFTGELPTADLSGALDQEERELQSSKERLEQTKAAQDMHGAWNRGLRKVYGELEQRISEKQAGQWSTVIGH